MFGIVLKTTIGLFIKILKNGLYFIMEFLVQQIKQIKIKKFLIQLWKKDYLNQVLVKCIMVINVKHIKIVKSQKKEFILLLILILQWSLRVHLRECQMEKSINQLFNAKLNLIKLIKLHHFKDKYTGLFNNLNII